MDNSKKSFKQNKFTCSQNFENMPIFTLNKKNKY